MTKTILMTLILFTTCFNASAVSILCKSGSVDGPQHNFLKEDMEADCKVIDLKVKGSIIDGRIQNFDLLDTEEVTMSLQGVGPGMRLNLVEGILISCPLVMTTEKLIRSSFYGIKVGAGALLGASLGLFSNKRLGVCLMTSLGVHSYGAGISGAQLTFK
jgi:hypothetical protein